MEDNFTVEKIDMLNAFNLVSRQTFLAECATHFTELLSWVVWCYGAYSILWLTLFCGISMGQIYSQSGVQQGDSLRPLLFSLVASAVDSVGECLNLLFQACFLDN